MTRKNCNARFIEVSDVNFRPEKHLKSELRCCVVEHAQGYHLSADISDDKLVEIVHKHFEKHLFMRRIDLQLSAHFKDRTLVLV